MIYLLNVQRQVGDNSTFEVGYYGSQSRKLQNLVNANGPVPVAADGTATFATSSLTAGSHPLTATYSGTPALAGSAGSLTQVVLGPPVADAGGPYAVAEGDVPAVVAGKRRLDRDALSEGCEQSMEDPPALILLLVTRRVEPPEQVARAPPPAHQLGIGGVVKRAGEHLLAFGGGFR